MLCHSGIIFVKIYLTVETRKYRTIKFNHLRFFLSSKYLPKVMKLVLFQVHDQKLQYVYEVNIWALHIIPWMRICPTNLPLEFSSCASIKIFLRGMEYFHFSINFYYMWPICIYWSFTLVFFFFTWYFWNILLSLKLNIGGGIFSFVYKYWWYFIICGPLYFCLISTEAPCFSLPIFFEFSSYLPIFSFENVLAALEHNSVDSASFYYIFSRFEFLFSLGFTLRL